MSSEAASKLGARTRMNVSGLPMKVVYETFIPNEMIATPRMVAVVGRSYLKWWQVHRWVRSYLFEARLRLQGRWK